MRILFLFFLVKMRISLIKLGLNDKKDKKKKNFMCVSITLSSQNSYINLSSLLKRLTIFSLSTKKNPSVKKHSIRTVTMSSAEPEREHREEEEAAGAEDEDTGAQVAPIVRLEEVAVTTGEENEDAILDL